MHRPAVLLSRKSSLTSDDTRSGPFVLGYAPHHLFAIDRKHCSAASCVSPLMLLLLLLLLRPSAGACMQARHVSRILAMHAGAAASQRSVMTHVVMTANAVDAMRVAAAASVPVLPAAVLSRMRSQRRSAMLGGVLLLAGRKVLVDEREGREDVEGGDNSVECPELHHGLLEDERLEGPRKARCDLEPHLRGDDTDRPRVSDSGEVLHDKGEGEPEDAADALRGGLCEECLVED